MHGSLEITLPTTPESLPLTSMTPSCMFLPCVAPRRYITIMFSSRLRQVNKQATRRFSSSYTVEDMFSVSHKLFITGLTCFTVYALVNFGLLAKNTVDRYHERKRIKEEGASSMVGTTIRLMSILFNVCHERTTPSNISNILNISLPLSRP